MKIHIITLLGVLLPVIGMMSKDKVTLLVCLSTLVIASVLLSIKKTAISYKAIEEKTEEIAKANVCGLKRK